MWTILLVDSLNPASFKAVGNVRFGSLADLLTDITPTAASGAKPAVCEADFQNSNLNDCFTQKRSFKLFENHSNEGPLPARSGPFRQTL